NDNGDPKVIEYNCRMGDPETEVVIPRVKNDLVELLLATSGKKLKTVKLEIDERAAATVVAVSGGYPGDYQKGKVISGLEENLLDDTMVFLAGAKHEGDQVVTNGGRVFTVTSFGTNIAEAVEQSNYVMEQLFFEDMYFRSDIGYEFRSETN
ncbi:MAG TPA: phosphoribosylglycinamide synthetase C domain-containing protein, partial [Ferruginibacter sp.]|nr:phosphoribosylglycinamide synthetase C domain-containing protein [Ferruginibacter sp.]